GAAAAGESERDGERLPRAESLDPPGVSRQRLEHEVDQLVDGVLVDLDFLRRAVAEHEEALVPASADVAAQLAARPLPLVVTGLLALGLRVALLFLRDDRQRRVEREEEPHVGHVEDARVLHGLVPDPQPRDEARPAAHAVDARALLTLLLGLEGLVERVYEDAAQDLGALRRVLGGVAGVGGRARRGARGGALALLGR